MLLLADMGRPLTPVTPVLSLITLIALLETFLPPAAVAASDTGAGAVLLNILLVLAFPPSAAVTVAVAVAAVSALVLTVAPSEVFERVLVSLSNELLFIIIPPSFSAS